MARAMAKKATVERRSKPLAGRKASLKRRGTTAKRKTASTKRSVRYPIAETLRWVAEGEILLIKWGAIKSPGAKRVAGTVAKILSVLEALMELRKA